MANASGESFFTEAKFEDFVPISDSSLNLKIASLGTFLYLCYHYGGEMMIMMPFPWVQIKH
jgi:hypothetical protein